MARITFLLSAIFAALAIWLWFFPPAASKIVAHEALDISENLLPSELSAPPDFTLAPPAPKEPPAPPRGQRPPREVQVAGNPTVQDRNRIYEDALSEIESEIELKLQKLIAARSNKAKKAVKDDIKKMIGAFAAEIRWKAENTVRPEVGPGVETLYRELSDRVNKYVAATVDTANAHIRQLTADYNRDREQTIAYYDRQLIQQNDMWYKRASLLAAFLSPLFIAISALLAFFNYRLAKLKRLSEQANPAPSTSEPLPL
jgi:preprotein translocase subunit SecG